MPYIIIGVALVLLAIVIGVSKLPKIESAQHHLGEKVGDSIWRHPNLESRDATAPSELYPLFLKKRTAT